MQTQKISVVSFQPKKNSMSKCHEPDYQQMVYSSWFTPNWFTLSVTEKESLAWALENVEEIGVHQLVFDFYAEVSNMTKFRVWSPFPFERTS